MKGCYLKQYSRQCSLRTFTKEMKNIYSQITSVFVVFLVSQKAFAFDNTINPLKTNLVFASFGGKENFGSVNCEHIFSTNSKLNWSYIIGVQPFQLSKKFSLPVSLNAFTRAVCTISKWI